MIDRLAEFIVSRERLLLLTGAGVSTASGIPDYRDERGEWKQQRPMEYRDFISNRAARQRYWTRSYYGWQRFGEAQPNAAHRALARLEQTGRVVHTITQNVDGLQQRAGSRRVTELHGSLASVDCLDCGASLARAEVQQELLLRNPQFAGLSGSLAPDGDARLQAVDESLTQVPECPACGGILKPAVVFFGESVPAERVRQCRDALSSCDGLLVVGSSLMVFSGFRFVREAVQQGIPVAAVNRGITRADALLQHKFELDCAAALQAAMKQIDPESADSSARKCDPVPA